MKIFFVTLLFSVSSYAENLTFFNDAGGYLGLDYTNDISPQCIPDFDRDWVYNRITSNMGLWANIGCYKDVCVDMQYTHHSCVFNNDRNVYDSVGFHAKWYFWRRK